MSFILKKTRVNTDFFELKRRFFEVESFAKSTSSFNLDKKITINSNSFNHEKTDFEFFKTFVNLDYNAKTLQSEFIYTMSTSTSERCFDIFVKIDSKTLSEIEKNEIEKIITDFLENIRQFYNKNWIIQDTDLSIFSGANNW